MNKIRVRFGIKLYWPITNAATFVGYVTQEQFDKAEGAVFTLRSMFPAASALFVEKA